MRRFVLVAILLGPVLLLVAFSGCNPKGTPIDRVVIPAPERKDPAPRVEHKTALQAKGRDGVLTGKVIYNGDPPNPEAFAQVKFHTDKHECLKGGPAQTTVQTWIVNKENKGVANVVVWLEPPEGKYFSLTQAQTKRPGEKVLIDQPHCAFIPHAVTLFPFYDDGTNLKETGQELVIKNSAPINHAAGCDGSLVNPKFSHNMPPNSTVTKVLYPQKKPLHLGCGTHSWMHAIVWIFAHPYHTVSKEDGSFEIKDLPTGVELTFKAWHESRLDPFEKRKITLESGANPPVVLSLKKKE